MRNMFYPLTASAFLLFLVPSCLGQTINGSKHWADFAADLTDLERLSDLAFTSVRMVSTYDRNGGNKDGFNPEFLKNGIYTIADLKGPGVIRRFYAARPGGQLQTAWTVERSRSWTCRARSFLRIEPGLTGKAR